MKFGTFFFTAYGSEAPLKQMIAISKKKKGGQIINHKVCSVFKTGLVNTQCIKENPQPILCYSYVMCHKVDAASAVVVLSPDEFVFHAGA